MIIIIKWRTLAISYRKLFMFNRIQLATDCSSFHSNRFSYLLFILLLPLFWHWFFLFFDFREKIAKKKFWWKKHKIEYSPLFTRFHTQKKNRKKLSKVNCTRKPEFKLKLRSSRSSTHNWIGRLLRENCFQFATFGTRTKVNTFSSSGMLLCHLSKEKNW